MCNNFQPWGPMRNTHHHHIQGDCGKLTTSVGGPLKGGTIEWLTNIDIFSVVNCVVYQRDLADLSSYFRIPAVELPSDTQRLPSLSRTLLCRHSHTARAPSKVYVPRLHARHPVLCASCRVDKYPKSRSTRSSPGGRTQPTISLPCGC